VVVVGVCVRVGVCGRVVRAGIGIGRAQARCVGASLEQSWGRSKAPGARSKGARDPLPLPPHHRQSTTHPFMHPPTAHTACPTLMTMSTMRSSAPTFSAAMQK
jgi:hypothetical protein